MTDRERAEAKAREITGPHVICGDGVFSPNTTVSAIKAFETLIADALMDFRREALEEALQVPNEWLRQFADTKIDHVRADQYARDAVADIRDRLVALATPAGGKEG